MVLICYDGSPDAKTAIKLAGDLLGDHPAAVLTVWEPFMEVMARSPSGFGMAPGMVDVGEIDSANEKSAHARAEEGALLSGGQRQRLALARALLSESRFWILDEPTVHLDAPLAARVMKAIQERTRGRSLLVITHASEHLDGFDRVVRVHAGRLEGAPMPVGARP